MEKVGVGGAFIKAKDVKSLTAWCQKQLGIEFGNNSCVDFKRLNKDPATPEYDYGKFGLIIDPEGNKIELW